MAFNIHIVLEPRTKHFILIDILFHFVVFCTFFHNLNKTDTALSSFGVSHVNFVCFLSVKMNDFSKGFFFCPCSKKCERMGVAKVFF